MFYILLSVLCSCTIAVAFKLRAKLDIKLFPVIVLNYITAVLWSFLLNKSDFVLSEIIKQNWIYSAIAAGFLLIIGFFLIGFCTQKIGITITTVSNKMSVVLPMSVSIFIFNENVDFLKIAGILFALISVFLVVYNKNNKNFDKKYLYLPVLLFVTIGAIDSMIKIGQTDLKENETVFFSAISFGISGVIGIIFSFFNKSKFKDFFNQKVILTGIVTGTANFGSMYFIISALNKSGLDSSVVFGIINISVISVSTLIAFFIFKEKLKPINWIGVLLAIFAIIILTRIFI